MLSQPVRCFTVPTQPERLNASPNPGEPTASNAETAEDAEILGDPGVLGAQKLLFWLTDERCWVSRFTIHDSRFTGS